MRPFRSLVLAALVASPMTVLADAQDDAVAAKCPNAQAWQKTFEKAHAEQTGEARARRDLARQFTAPAYREELHRRFLADQAARNAWIAAGMKPDGWPAVHEVDADNLAWFKPRVAKQGFPTVAQVGERGVDEAFYLVQHNPDDSAFQKAVLPALTSLAKQNLIAKADLAMLTDRILRYEGKPQIYGTQYIGTQDQPGMRLQPTDDVAHLDARRATMDLMPSADNACVINVVYAPATVAP